MSNNKESSINFLFQNMFELSQTLVISGETQYELMMQVYQQAKAMHKEEMDKVAGDFWNEGASYVYNGQRKYNSFEQYYNETFGGEQ